MLMSMTGFGSSSGNIEGVAFNVEIRSVNNRYFKAIIKLPEMFNGLESQLESRLRRRITRGSIVLAVRAKLPDDKAASKVNIAAMEKYLQQLRELEIDANPTLRIDLGQLLLMPGVCEAPSLADIAVATQDFLLGLVDKAIDGLMEMRKREGDSLRGDLFGNCDLIARNLDMVAVNAPQVVREYYERLSQRVAELTQAARLNIDDVSIAREVAIYAERCDIAEEVTRLRGHLEHFRSAGDGPEPAGRKLDFIAQEMLREANTIASKSSDSQIAHAVVEMKTAIDRIKEQAANVE